GLERRERRGLERGTLTIEARIDLHGLYQAEAHAALVGFLLRSRAAGHARVLVVTGKGGEGFGGRDRGGFSERGVLRRSVPHWLRGPELRGLVLGFEEAARHHGGGGALYVRLRRR
ncbi:MAG: Smr/MutS family protein, partial [Methylorubrum extorquens]